MKPALCGVLLVALTGCSGAPAPQPSPTAKAVACADGNCRISVSQPVTVTVGAQFAMSRLVLSIKANRVVINVQGTDGEPRGCDAVATGACEINAGGDPLYFNVLSVADGTAVVDIKADGG